MKLPKECAAGVPYEVCGVIPPRRRDVLGTRDDGYSGECILPNAHWCAHVLLTPEGEYIQWEDDFSCDCCAPEEADRCYSFGPITKEEVEKLAKECG